MKITYIGHSGFFVEMEQICFLFDYYRGKIPEIRAEKELFVFVSHRHEDHYNSKVFELIKKNPKVRFVLSSDIRTKQIVEAYREKGIDLASHIVSVKKYTTQQMELPGGRSLTIETLKSTDEGVAFLLTMDGEKIYHAGDLNLWLWEGESKQYNNNMKAVYFKELEKLRGAEIDVAFVPLDPRQEGNAYDGMLSFLEYTESKHIFPMHFWGKYEIIREFLNQNPEYQKKIEMIEREGQEFTI